jgi:hypothetical protein
MIEFADEGMPSRFWAKVERLDNDCWEWTGTVGYRGYGDYWHNGGMRKVHRVAYLCLVGPIPEDLQIDHLCHVPQTCETPGIACRHRRCVNPAHMAIVSQIENCAPERRVWTAPRPRTHCKSGHPFDEQNTYTSPLKGHRSCRICNSKRNADKYAAAKAGAW